MPNKINCVLCNSNTFETLGEKNSFHVVKCKVCDLVYINPQPTEDETKKIYNQSYFSGGHDFGYQGIDYLGKENENWFKYLPTKTLDKIEKMVNKGNILDIGCAVGYFLEVAKERGWKISGIELSDFAAKKAGDKLGIKIFQNFNQANFPKNHFNVITAFEIIEHLQDPKVFLKNILSYLNPEGIIGISTPNLENAKSFKNFLEWNCLTPPEHLFFFSKDTITKLLNSTGFEVIEIFFGPINPLNKIQNQKIQGIKNIYHRFKPILQPIKKILYDLPMNIYGRKSGKGEDMIIIAKPKKTA